MKPKAIVYTSNTGFTKKYARLLSEKTGLTAYSMDEGRRALAKGADIIYMGWLMASHVKDHGKAAKRYNICAVCGVGLCNTGGLLDETRKATKICDDIPLFTLQGGIRHGELRGINKFMINMLVKMLSKQAEKSEKDEAMLALLSTDGDYVNEENLADVLEWFERQ